MANLVKFNLIGPNAGKTIGLSKTHTGDFRYNFVNGVMEVHPSKVNGRFINFMRTMYGAVVEGEDDGKHQADQDGNNAVGSTDVQSDLTAPKTSPAAGSAVKLSGNDKAKAGRKK